MKESKLLLTIGLLFISSVGVSAARGCACGPEPVPASAPAISGGIAFASFGNGAYFTWDTYVAPVVHIALNGTSTTVTTSAGYFTNSSDNNGKFIFKKDMYTWGNMNKVNPDIVELQKVLVNENLLGNNSQTGIYDGATKAAVAAFQKKYGIKPAPQYTYGYFGPLTRAYLNNK